MRHRPFQEFCNANTSPKRKRGGRNAAILPRWRVALVLQSIWNERYVAWLFAIAVFAGSGVCPAASPSPWEAALRPRRPAAVFDVAENPTVTLVVRNLSGQGSAVAIHFEVSDYDGRLLHSGSLAAAVPRGEIRAIDLRLGDAAKLPHGEYLAARVTLVADGKLQADFRKGFGFLPKQNAAGPPEKSPFGLLAEYHWPLLEQIGVRYVRPNWSWDERPMEWASRYRIAYCPLVNEANAFVREESSAAEYAEFVRQSVRRYKGYVRYWQLGNEFDIFHRDGPKSYVEAQRIGYAAAKAEDPNCLVVGGSITELQVRREGWKESLALGLAKYCDIYDFHFYSDLVTTQDLLDYIHRTCREFRAEKPIWVTETTQVGMFDPDDRNQAEYVFKRYTHLLASGVSVVFWHALAWPYPFEADKTQATAMIDHAGFARPSLFAFAALARDLGGARFVRRWDAGKDVYALEFAKGNRAVLVLWSEGGPRSMTLRHPAGDTVVTHVSGKRTVRPAGHGPTQVKLSKRPVIYDLSGPVTEIRESAGGDTPGPRLPGG